MDWESKAVTHRSSRRKETRHHFEQRRRGYLRGLTPGCRRRSERRPNRSRPTLRDWDSEDNEVHRRSTCQTHGRLRRYTSRQANRAARRRRESFRRRRGFRQTTRKGRSDSQRGDCKSFRSMLRSIPRIPPRFPRFFPRNLDRGIRLRISCRPRDLSRNCPRHQTDRSQTEWDWERSARRRPTLGPSKTLPPRSWPLRSLVTMR